MPIITSQFCPSGLLRNAHVQTLLANSLQPPWPRIREETLELSDGDFLQLFHGPVDGPERVLILHGLEGSLKSPYTRRILNYLAEQGIPATIMLFRSCSAQPNRLSRSYHSGDTGDLAEVIEHLKLQGCRRLALIGYSLGGNVTLKYMGKGQTDDTVICATAVSVPLRLDICAERMQQGFSRFYQWLLLRRLNRKVKAKRSLLETEGYDCSVPSRSFVEFDDRFTAPLHGFSSAEDYYQRCSSRQFLRGIDRPTLILHARDDPFMTSQVIPAEDELSNQVTLELADHGGHVGFIEGSLFKPDSWLEPRIYRWLQQKFLKQDTSDLRVLTE